MPELVADRAQKCVERRPDRAGSNSGLGPSGRILLLALCLGCASPPAPPPPKVEPPARQSVDIAVYRRAETERAARLAKQVVRLQADLRQAEEALVMAESGLRGTHSRADAVSRLAEARVQVERAAVAAPWRTGELEQARAKLAEAEHQVEKGHFGAALFFVYRAQRIADSLEAEAAQVYAEPETRFVRGRGVNLRAGPSTSEPVLGVLADGTPVFPERRRASWILVRTASGSAGWVHSTLLKAN